MLAVVPPQPLPRPFNQQLVEGGAADVLPPVHLDELGIGTLKAVLSWFKDLRLVDANPFADVAQPEMDRHEVNYVKQSDRTALSCGWRTAPSATHSCLRIATPIWMPVSRQFPASPNRGLVVLGCLSCGRERARCPELTRN
jgi:hypothetical protein